MLLGEEVWWEFGGFLFVLGPIYGCSEKSKNLHRRQTQLRLFDVWDREECHADIQHSRFLGYNGCIRVSYLHCFEVL